MTTPCRATAVAAFLLAALGAAGIRGETATSGKTSADLFAARRDEILAVPSGSLAIEGRVFCVGRARSPRELGNAIGEERARSMAKARFLDFIRNASPWPDDATDEDRILAWTLLLSETPISIEDVSAEQLFADHPGEGLFRAVLVFPETAALAARPSTALLSDAVSRIRALREEVERERLAKDSSNSESTPADTPSATPAATRLDTLRQDVLDWTEPRGLFETNGIIVNETMSDSLL